MIKQLAALSLGVVVSVLGATPRTAIAEELPPVVPFLESGRLSAGAAAMQAAIDANPADQQARFSLGVVQFLQAVEGLGYDHYRYGLLGDRRRQITFMRLPVPENSAPEKLTYSGARQILQNYADGLAKAEATLAQVKPSDIKLPLAVGMIRLDLDRNGQATDEESLWAIIQGLQNPRATNTAAQDAEKVVIAFDDADVLWLQGYCHVMAGLAEIALAYNWEEQFNCTAHLFYPNVETPYPFLAEEGTGVISGFNTQNVLDIIAMIHTVNYEVAEPERMQVALAHFESVIRLSRQSWTLIEAETDNDREWIPNASQTSAMAGLRVGQGMIKNWAKFLDEMELILQGRKLLPFWRGVKDGVPLFLNQASQVPTNSKLGINVRRIFTDPHRLDLVLWLQGTGLAPFLEEGPRVDVKTFEEISREFQGEFLTFMFWFN